MSATTIEWTHRPGTTGEVWNPTTGCNKVDRGCKHCYAEVMHRRLMAIMPEKYNTPFLAGAVAHPEVMDIPRHWKKPRTVFVDSMSDLFHVNIQFSFILSVFIVMEETPQHTYLILTKRPERAVEFWAWCNSVMVDWSCPPNVWIGTSANDQASAELRVPLLLQLHGCLRFLSYEPATGSVLLRRLAQGDGTQLDALAGVVYDADHTLKRDMPRLHWVICGGESGSKAQPMHPAWARQVRDDCQATGTPFFFKQWGRWQPINYPSKIFENQITYKFNLGKNEFLFTEPTPQNMVKGEKSFNLLDGVAWQQFPTSP